MIYETDSKNKSRLVITTGRDFTRTKQKAKILSLCFSLTLPFHVLGEMVLHKGGYLRFQIPCFVIDDVERERSRIPVTLQGSLADLQHHADFLIVQEWLAVEHRALGNIGNGLLQMVETDHNPFHPFKKSVFVQ